MIWRFLYAASIAMAFLAGIAGTDIWLRRAASPPPAPPAKTESQPARESAENRAEPAASRTVAVSIDDEAQVSAPRPTSEPSAAEPATPAAPDSAALNDRVEQVLSEPVAAPTRLPGGLADPAAGAPEAHPPAATANAPPAAVATSPSQEPGLEAMIGQMLIFGFQGTTPEQKWPQAVAAQLARGQIGGVIFLKYNLANPADARRLIDFFRSARKRAPPPFLVLDQEGGRVQRIGAQLGEKRFPSPAVVGRGSLEAARSHFAALAGTVDRWGFNVNLAPVVDVNLNPANPVIAKLGRSFSSDPAKVIKFASAFIDAHRARGVLTALKHFPGHGSSRNDSHLGFTDISGTWKRDEELAPYAALIAAGKVDMVMPGHLYLSQFSGRNPDDRFPATFSKQLINGLLRGDRNRGGLGYRGVVISDDMEMGAIRKHYGTYVAAVRAIKAGVDLLIVSNTAKPQIGLPLNYIAQIRKAAETDPELRARIAESYRRIVALKARLSPRSGRVRPGDRS